MHKKIFFNFLVGEIFKKNLFLLFRRRKIVKKQQHFFYYLEGEKLHTKKILFYYSEGETGCTC